MTRKKTFKIGSIGVAPGQVKDLKIKISESYIGHPVYMHVRMMRGVEPGPALFVMAAIHGDELNGTGIVRELMFNDIKLKRGTLVCIPVANVFGLEHHSRYLPDRRDLNRYFPGRQFGSMAERLAYVLFQEIVVQCDYGIDLHTAANRRTNFPHVRADLSVKGIERMAFAFGSEIVVDRAGPPHSLRNEACAIGCPTIIFEAGEVLKFEPSIVTQGLKGIKNVLIALNMVDGKLKRPDYQTVVSRTVWIRAHHGGLLRFHVQPGALIRKGDRIATVEGLFAKEIHQILAPEEGIILNMTTIPAIKPGEPLCHLAVPGKPIREIEESTRR